MFKYASWIQVIKDILRLRKIKKFVAGETSEFQKEVSRDISEVKSKEAENIRNEEKTRVAVSMWTNTINYSSLAFSKICLKVESKTQNIVKWNF